MHHQFQGCEAHHTRGTPDARSRLICAKLVPGYHMPRLLSLQHRRDLKHFLLDYVTTTFSSLKHKKVQYV
jgi:hypothetical protein